VKGRRYRGDVGGRFFTQRMVGMWNALPVEVDESESLETFKQLLDRYMDYGRMMECDFRVRPLCKRTCCRELPNGPLERASKTDL